jgi:hypothetical protein
MVLQGHCSDSCYDGGVGKRPKGPNLTRGSAYRIEKCGQLRRRLTYGLDTSVRDGSWYHDLSREEVRVAGQQVQVGGVQQGLLSSLIG